MPLIAFLCHFYSFNYKETMDLPARTAFALYREGRRLEAEQHLEQLRIAATPAMKIQWYEYMHDLYSGRMDPQVLELPEKPNTPSARAQDLANVETKNKIIHMFHAGRRSLGLR